MSSAIALGTAKQVSDCIEDLLTGCRCGGDADGGQCAPALRVCAL